MKRVLWLIGLLCLLFLLVGVSVGSDVAVTCRSIDLAAIEWVASINDEENPDTLGNHANIIQNTDEHGEYFGMEWNSPEFTDLSLNALDHFDRQGTESISLTLSASEPMQVEMWVSTDSGYCGQDGSMAACSLALEVGTEPTTFNLPASSFDHHPFSSCSDVMSKGDLELIGSIYLFPSARSGELRVYEVALCGEHVEVAIDEPEPVPVAPETPTFAIDPDVTLDSVVQVGDGPQELSTDIKFYPNTRRIKPGETVYWTLDLGDLQGPFTIVPEMDNDMSREASMVASSPLVVLEHRYEKPNLYVPYVRVRLQTGEVRTVWTMNSLLVEPGVLQQSGVGLKMPTVSDPYGEVLKAGHLMLVDQELFSAESGRDTMAYEIAHWASTGFNLIIIDILWFLDDLDSCLLVPIYESSPQPDFWMGTMDFEEVMWLTQQIHRTGMKVAWRFAPTIKRDHSMIERFEYRPSSLELSVQSQLVTKPVYAALADACNVELFGIDMENDSFTLSRESIEVVNQVKEVFFGPVFDSPFSNRALRSPVSPYLDLILFSTDPHNFSTIESVDQKIGAFRHQYETELLRPLLELQKPGIFEVYADGLADPQSQADAYEAMLGVIEHANSLIQGIDVFDLVLYPGWSNLTWTPMDRPAEQILKEFFNERLPDERFFDFGQKLSPPEPMQVLSSFEESETASYEVGSYNGIAAGAIDPVDPNEGDQSLKVVFCNQKPKDDWANFSITYNYSSPQDWHRFSTLSFWHKNDGNPASILVSIFDSDGDRFVAELWITYEKPGSWMPYTVHLDSLFSPSWHTGGNGRLDLGRAAGLEIMEKVHDESDHTSWFDSIYLGGPAASSDSGVSPHDLAVNAPTIDPDVTLDSVVQVGDGPQELSTDIKFYPNTRRIKPGETVYWTLDLGDLEGPFTIVPEMDNDTVREATIWTSEKKMVISHEYGEANPHRPYLVISGGNGTTMTVFSSSLLSVVPVMQQQQGVGLKLPTSTDPLGDVLKGGQLNIVDEQLFHSEDGLEYIHKQVQRWVEDGINLVILSILWIVNANDANVLIPVYEKHVPDFGKATNKLENLIAFTSILHDHHIRVGWNLVLQWIGETAGTSRFEFCPTDLDLYFSGHTQVDVFYAAIAEDLGVEMFGLDAENAAFSLDPRSIQTLREVRKVYSGAIFDAPLQSDAMASLSPLTPHLDLVIYSAGPDNLEPSLSLEEMTNAFTNQYLSQLVQPLNQFGKPGVFQIFADGQSNPAFQANVYNAILSTFANVPSLLCGVVFWELTINPEWTRENPLYNPIGRPAEQVMSEYFNNVLPDQRFYEFALGAAMPAVLETISSFEDSLTSPWQIAALNGNASISNSPSNPQEASRSLKISFNTANRDGQFANYTLDYT